METMQAGAAEDEVKLPQDAVAKEDNWSHAELQLEMWQSCKSEYCSRYSACTLYA